MAEINGLGHHPHFAQNLRSARPGMTIHCLVSFLHLGYLGISWDSRLWTKIDKSTWKNDRMEIEDLRQDVESVESFRTPVVTTANLVVAALCQPLSDSNSTDAISNTESGEPDMIAQTF